LGNDPVRPMADVSLGSDFAEGAYRVSVNPGWEGQKRVESKRGAVAWAMRQRSVSSLRSSNRDMEISPIRLSDKTSRLRPRLVVAKPAQTYEPEVPVKVREWIGPALASPDFVLEPQPPA
jgi:hypothetical protein